MRFILDTSLFSNPDTQIKFGKDVNEAVNNFIHTCKKNSIEIFLPTSIFRELSHFISEEIQILLRRSATIKAPDLFSLQVPAAIFHTFIGDLRNRINKGLRITEEAIKEKMTDKTVKKIRQKYREALRSGIVDSVEDLDVVMLAKELKAAILSADEGIANMAESLGIEVFMSRDFIQKFGI